MHITLLRKADKFSPSQSPYWFDTSSIQHKKRGASIDAVWFGRKKGRTTITLGTYPLYFPDDRKLAPVAHIVEVADTRYGGAWLYQWDGERFLREPTSPLNLPADLAAMQTKLATILASPNDPFPGEGQWIGPYYKTKVPGRTVK